MAFPYRKLVFLFGGRPREAVARSHQLARYFADAVSVLYIPYGSFRHWLDGEWRNDPWQPLAGHPNLQVLRTSPAICLGRRFGVAGQVNAWSVARRLRRMLASEDIPEEQVLLFVYSPVAAPIVRRFPKATVHYDCADDHENWWNASRRMARLNRSYEQYVAERARTVTATSRSLLQKMRDYAAARCQASLLSSPPYGGGVGGVDPPTPGDTLSVQPPLPPLRKVGTKSAEAEERVFLVPNGVDWQHFASGSEGLPEELRQLPRPLLGFIGVAADYVDWELVRALASARIGSLVFVGPPRRFQRAYQGLDNVHFLGPRPYEDLPRYVHAFDVCLIPANRHPAALAANPSKLYQYLAAGKPVVATNLPELTAHSDVIYVAENGDEFLCKVREALTDAPALAALRRERAREASWQRRAETILNIVAEHSTDPVPARRDRVSETDTCAASPASLI